MVMPSYLSSPEDLMFQTYQTKMKYGTADPMQVEYALRQKEMDDQQAHQAFMQRYTRDLDDAQQMSRMRQGIYESPDQMLMDRYGPAYEYEAAPQERNIHFGFADEGAPKSATAGFGAGFQPHSPMESIPVQQRVPKAEFRGAIEAMRTRNFQEVKGAPAGSRYAEKSKALEVLNKTIASMSVSDPNRAELIKMQASLAREVGSGEESTVGPSTDPDVIDAARQQFNSGLESFVSGLPQRLSGVPILGQLAKMAPQFLPPKDPIMYSEGDAPLAPASAKTPASASVSVRPTATGNWWASVSEADKKRYKQAAANGDRNTMAEIRSRYGAS